MNIDVSLSFMKRHWSVKAFVIHKGPNKDTGHYITYVLHKNIWYSLNDEKVAQVSESHALKCARTAYYLLFEKVLENDIAIYSKAE